MLERLPEGKAEQETALAKVMHAFQAADEARQPREERMYRYHEQYSGYAEAEDKAEDNWRSKIFVPAIFYVVETVAPRLVAQLPEAVVEPVEASDVEGAEALKAAIDWSTEVTGLYVQMVAAMKDALTYGTGFLKTYADTRSALELVSEPIYEDVTRMLPVIDPETGQPLRDINGGVVVEEQLIGQQQMGTRRVPKQYQYYRGPAAEAVDPFNFWFAPEASDIDSARFVIQREFMTRKEFEKLVAEGYYTMPEHLSASDFYALVDDPKFKRYAMVGLGGGQSNDPTYDAVELIEFWENGRKVCMANRSAIVAVGENPFLHQQKPFVRLVDHFQQHDPYGIGEVQMLEGLQDEVNALVNSRIDAVKLAMHLMFFVDEDALVDTSDLRVRPGGRVRVRNRYGLPLDQIIKRIDFGDVTSSAYVEVQEALQAMERFSGTVGPPGPEDPAVYRTATGVVNIAEGMQARYAHKLKMMELTGLQRLFEHFGVLLQQYVDQPMYRRVLGENGAWQHFPITPDSIQGRFDFKVQAESSAMTETARRELSLMLYNQLSANPMVNPIKPIEEVLRKHGIKDVQNWIADPMTVIEQMLQQMPPEQQLQLAQQIAMSVQQQAQPAQEGAPVG